MIQELHRLLIGYGARLEQNPQIYINTMAKDDLNDPVQSVKAKILEPVHGVLISKLTDRERRVVTFRATQLLPEKRRSVALSRLHTGQQSDAAFTQATGTSFMRIQPKLHIIADIHALIDKKPQTDKQPRTSKLRLWTITLAQNLESGELSAVNAGGTTVGSELLDTLERFLRRTDIILQAWDK